MAACLANLPLAVTNDREQQLTVLAVLLGSSCCTLGTARCCGELSRLACCLLPLCLVGLCIGSRRAAVSCDAVAALLCKRAGSAAVCLCATTSCWFCCCLHLQEETASIEAVLAEADAAEAEAAAVLADVPSYDLGRELAEAAAYAATGAPVPAAEYEQYLAALKAWDASQAAPTDDATVQQLLAGGRLRSHSTPACATA